MGFTIYLIMSLITGWHIAKYTKNNKDRLRLVFIHILTTLSLCYYVYEKTEPLIK